MELDGQIVQVLSYEHQKIGRGSAQVRMKVKNIRTGAIFDTTAQAGTKWPRIRLEQRHVQYLFELRGAVPGPSVPGRCDLQLYPQHVWVDMLLQHQPEKVLAEWRHGWDSKF